MLFNAATIHGTAVGELSRAAGAKLSEEDRAQRATAWSARAVELLRECDKLLGAPRRAILRKAIADDSSFDPIRGADVFTAFWKEIGGE